MPEGWLAGIIDMEGRFVARVPNRDDKVGQLASEGWRAVQGREGVFEFASLEGDTVVQGNALSKASGWAIGIAVRKTALMAGAWSTIRWTVLSGCGLLALSLLLAGLIARSITEPRPSCERMRTRWLMDRPPISGRERPKSPNYGSRSSARSKIAIVRKCGFNRSAIASRP